jgi:excisionase family DNA binding protein
MIESRRLQTPQVLADSSASTRRARAKASCRLQPRLNTAEIEPMPTESNVSRLGLSTSQAARELGVSLGTVRRWADLGHLRAYRTPGGQRRFSAEQIEEFVRSLEQRNSGSRRAVS